MTTDEMRAIARRGVQICANGERRQQKTEAYRLLYVLSRDWMSADTEGTELTDSDWLESIGLRYVPGVGYPLTEELAIFDGLLGWGVYYRSAVERDVPAKRICDTSTRCKVLAACRLTGVRYREERRSIS